MKKSAFQHFWLIPFLALAVALRVVKPTADAPLGLDFSQGINTDWGWYLNRALAALGKANLDPTLPEVYDRPFITYFARLHFAIFGTDLTALTLFNLIPGVLIVALLYGILARQATRGTALAATLLATVNFILVMFSRVPLIYLWMCVAELGLVFAWQMATHSKRKFLWRLGILLAFLGFVLSYKLMAIFFLPLLIVAVAASPREKPSRTRKPKLFAAAFVIAALATLIFWQDIRAIWSQALYSISVYLGPVASWQDLSRSLWRFWRLTNTFIHFRMPLETLCAWVSVLAVGWIWIGDRAKVAMVDLYFVLVAVVGHLVLVPFEYAPLRFFIYLIPSLIYLAVRLPFLVKTAWLEKSDTRHVVKRMLFTSLWCCPIWSMAITLPFRQVFPREKSQWLLWFPLLASLVSGPGIALLLRWLFPLPPLSIVTRRLLPILFLTMMVFGQVLPYVRWFHQPTYTWKESKEDFAEILPPEASIVGAYAHFIAFGDTYRASKILVNPRSPQPFLDGIESVSASHLVIEARQAEDLYRPFLEANPDTLLLDRFFIRGTEIALYRLPRVLSPLALSLFEEGQQAAGQGKYALAKDSWLESARRYPASGASMRALYLSAKATVEIVPDEREQILTAGLQRNPEHPALWLEKLQRAKDQGATRDMQEITLRILQLTQPNFVTLY